MTDPKLKAVQNDVSEALSAKIPAAEAPVSDQELNALAKKLACQFASYCAAEDPALAASWGASCYIDKYTQPPTAHLLLVNSHVGRLGPQKTMPINSLGSGQ